LVLVIALRPQTPKHRPIRGGWSHYTDNSEPVDGNGAQNMVTVQSGFRTSDLLITDPTCLPTALTKGKESKFALKISLYSYQKQACFVVVVVIF
jgi:hypothetical protein